MERNDGATNYDGLPKDVLIVEDDPLIAIDVEESLRKLGVASIRTAASVTLALDMIAGRNPEFALLNVDLGGENTLRIAKQLDSLRTPFAFLTGYGARAELAAQFAGRPKLNKPYSISELEATLRRRTGGLRRADQ